MPKLFRQVYFHEADLEKEPDGYGRPCSLCAAPKTVYRVEGWYHPERGQIAQNVQWLHFCADHHAAARDAEQNMKAREE